MGHMGAAMRHACAHTWAIYRGSNGAYMGAYMSHSYPYKLYIASAKRLVQIRYKAWRFLTAFLIVLIFVPLNGGYMRAYMAIYRGIYGAYRSSNGPYMGAAMGHVWAHTWATWGQQWGIHGRIHGPHGSSNGVCMRAYIGHIWGSPIRRVERKGIVGNPFPSLD